MAPRAPDRGDIVFLSFTPQAGAEVRGERPALVLSPRLYNARVGLGLFCPITSRAKGYPFEVPIPDGHVVHGVVLADQVRSLDWRARELRHRGRLDEATVDEVLARIATLLGR